MPSKKEFSPPPLGYSHPRPRSCQLVAQHDFLFRSMPKPFLVPFSFFYVAARYLSSSPSRVLLRVAPPNLTGRDTHPLLIDSLFSRFFSLWRHFTRFNCFNKNWALAIQMLPCRNHFFIDSPTNLLFPSDSDPDILLSLRPLPMSRDSFAHDTDLFPPPPTSPPPLTVHEFRLSRSRLAVFILFACRAMFPPLWAPPICFWCELAFRAFVF